MTSPQPSASGASAWPGGPKPLRPVVRRRPLQGWGRVGQCSAASSVCTQRSSVQQPLPAMGAHLSSKCASRLKLASASTVTFEHGQGAPAARGLTPPLPHSPAWAACQAAAGSRHPAAAVLTNRAVSRLVAMPCGVVSRTRSGRASAASHRPAASAACWSSTACACWVAFSGGSAPSGNHARSPWGSTRASVKRPPHRRAPNSNSTQNQIRDITVQCRLQPESLPTLGEPPAAAPAARCERHVAAVEQGVNCSGQWFTVNRARLLDKIAAGRGRGAASDHTQGWKE